MIILDTNAISETTKPRPNDGFMRWLRFAPGNELYTTAITEAEIRHGAQISPKTSRREIDEAIAKVFAVRFVGRILPFDSAAAKCLPEIMINMQRNGRSYDRTDALIAAIALSVGAQIVTRNTSDFEFSGVEIINPWTA